jgi:hypothetical protein
MKKSIKIIAGVAVVPMVLLLSACGSNNSSTTSAPLESTNSSVPAFTQPTSLQLTQFYGDVVSNQGSNYALSTMSESQIDTVGEFACTQLSRGTTLQQLAINIGTSGSSADLTTGTLIVVAAAVLDLCPQYKSQASALGKGA